MWSVSSLTIFVAVLIAATSIFSIECHTAVAGQQIKPEYVKSMPLGIPADPGENGRNTLQGIDANDNGVRDDVEIWIAKRFADNEVARAVALQIAVAMQQVFVAGEQEDGQAIINQKAQIRAALECLIVALGDDVQGVIFSEMLGVIVNTPERVILIEKHEQSYPEPEGTVIAEPSLQACTILSKLVSKGTTK